MSFLKNYKYCVSEAISKKLLFFGSSQLAWQQQHRLNQWCEFKAGLSTNRRVFGNSVWKQSLFSWVVHKLHTLALTFLFWSSNCFSNIYIWQKLNKKNWWQSNFMIPDIHWVCIPSGIPEKRCGHQDAFYHRKQDRYHTEYRWCDYFDKAIISSLMQYCKHNCIYTLSFTFTVQAFSSSFLKTKSVKNVSAKKLLCEQKGMCQYS